MKSTNSAQWIKIGVMVFAAADCVGVYAARQRLNAPVDESQIVEQAPMVAYTSGDLVNDLPADPRTEVALAFPAETVPLPQVIAKSAGDKLHSPTFGRAVQSADAAKVQRAIVPSVKLNAMAARHGRVAFSSAFGRPDSLPEFEALGPDSLPKYAGEAGDSASHADNTLAVASTDIASAPAAVPTAENPFPTAPSQSGAQTELPALPAGVASAPTAYSTLIYSPLQGNTNGVSNAAAWVL